MCLHRWLARKKWIQAAVGMVLVAVLGWLVHGVGTRSAEEPFPPGTRDESATRPDVPPSPTVVTGRQTPPVVVRQNHQGVQVTGRTYRSTLAKDGITFQPRQGGPRWHWQLTHAGAEVVTGELAPEPVEGSETVQYHRGTITEQYRGKADHLEQLFVLHAPPARLEQDYVIQGRVVAEATFSHGMKGFTWADAQGAVTLGGLRVLDADHHLLTARLEASKDATRIVIAARELADARYPVVVDPDIGTNDLRISAVGTEGHPGGQAMAPAVAYADTVAGGQFLVVYSGDEDTDNTEEILARRIHATSLSVLDANELVVADGVGSDAMQPAVVFNPNRGEYLVVYALDMGANAGVTEYEIFAQRLAPTGIRLGSPFRVSRMGLDGNADYDGFHPDVDHDPIHDLYLVVWQGDHNGSGCVEGQNRIFGQLLTHDSKGGLSSMGSMLSLSEPPATPGLDAVNPTLAFNTLSGGYLVAWSAERENKGTFTIMLQRVQWDGALQGANVRCSQGVGSEGHAPDVAFNDIDNQFLVTWSGVGSGSPDEFEIWGQRLNASAQWVGGNVRLSTMGPADDPSYAAYHPSVAHDAQFNEYLVTWWGDSNHAGLLRGEFEIFQQRLGSDLTLRGAPRTRTSDMGASGQTGFIAQHPAVAHATHQRRFLVVWSGEDTPPGRGETEIFGQFYENWGVVINPIPNPVTEGDVASSYTMALAEPPGGTVTVSINGGSDVQLSRQPTSGFASSLDLVFHDGNWNTLQQVHVRAVDDQEAEDLESVLLVHKARGMGYENATLPPVSVIVNDNDVRYTVSAQDPTKPEGPGSTVMFSVRRMGSRAARSTVDMLLSGTAQHGADYHTVTVTGSQITYEPASGRISFAQGAEQASVTVRVVDDGLYEDAESITLSLVNPTVPNAGGTPGQASVGSPASVTIQDNDPAPWISVENARAEEGANRMEFTLRLNVASGKETVVGVECADGTAVNHVDFNCSPQDVRILAGATVGTCAFPLVHDALDEDDETFTVRLVRASGATVVDGEGEGVIVDDDASPVLIISSTNSPLQEGQSDTVAANLLVSVSAVSGRRIYVEYRHKDETAQAGVDYVGVVSPAVLMLTPGETSKMVQVLVNGDRLNEPDETFSVELSHPVAAELGTTRATVTIKNDDFAPTKLMMSGLSVPENQPAGTWVGAMSTEDPNPEDTHTYALVPGPGEQDNAWFQVEGNNLVTVQPFDHERVESLSIRLQTSDGNGGVLARSFLVRVENVNEPPVHHLPGPQHVDEDTPLPLPGFAVEDDKPMGPVQVTLTALHGAVSLGSATGLNLREGDGKADTTLSMVGPLAAVNGALQTLTFQPIPDFSGEASLTILTNDRPDRTDGMTDQDALSITVIPVNDPPTATNLFQVVVMDEDTERLAFDPVVVSDVDGDDPVAATLTLLNPTQGTLTVGSGHGETFEALTGRWSVSGAISKVNAALASVALLPARDVDVEIQIILEVVGIEANPSAPLPGRFLVEVTPINDSPVAAEDSYAVDEDTPLDVDPPGVLANDVDVDTGALLTAVVEGQAAHGAVTVEPDGALHYVPHADFSGTDHFVYHAYDGVMASAPVTVSVQVRPVNDAPVAVDDRWEMDEDGVLRLAAPGVLSNDTDADGDVLTAKLLTPPTVGIAELNPDGALVYTPGWDFHGTVTFTYGARDGTVDSAPATVTVVVRAVNDPPVAMEDSYQVHEDQVLTVVAPGVLANDHDVDSAGLRAVLDASATHGTVKLEADGSLTYVPDADFFGADGFTYHVEDGVDLSRVVKVELTVTATPDAPVAVADSFRVAINGRLDLPAPGILANDVDVDGEVLSVQRVQDVAHGVLELELDGALHYTPAARFHGEDGFTYVARDGTLSSSPATVTFMVVSLSAEPDAYVMDEDTVLTVPAPGVMGNDVVANGRAASVQLQNGTTHGMVMLESNGGLRYQPEANHHGSDQFTYRLVVDQENSTGEVTITVRPVNDAPEFMEPTPQGTLQGRERVALIFTVKATDVDGDALHYGAHGLPPRATLDPQTGRFAWTPTWKDKGSYTLTLEASDGMVTVRRPITVVVSVADTDGDGVPDSAETELGLDPDATDSDEDTITDAEELGDPLHPRDTDGDKLVDALDDDSDGDSVPDADEAGDTDLATPAVDTDRDGTPDYRDRDSDGDGVEDGTDSCPLLANAEQEDADEDGTGDACDQDRDGDGLSNDVEEAWGLDPDRVDSDDDSIADGEEAGDPTTPVDTDRDGMVDALDTDADGDGVPDANEAGDGDITTPAVDTDGDHLPNPRDRDSDNDGVEDGVDNCRLVANPGQSDANADGMGDACQEDDDGDGVLDEADNCPGAYNPDQADGNGNGIGTACDGQEHPSPPPPSNNKPLAPTPPTPPGCACVLPVHAHPWAMYGTWVVMVVGVWSVARRRKQLR